MNQSRFLAGLIGPVMAATGLSVLVNRALIQDLVSDLSHDYLLVIVVGVATLAVGLAIVTSHRVWKGWPAIITIFGWLAIISGFMRLVFPKAVSVMAPTLLASGGGLVLTGLGAALILLGGFLSWKAYGK